MTIKAKLLGGFSILAVLMVLMALYTDSRLRSLKHRVDDLVDVSSTRVVLAAKIQQDLLALHRAEKNLVLAETPEEMGQQATVMVDIEQELLRKLETLKGIASAQDQSQIAAFEQALAAFKDISAQVQEASQRNTTRQAVDLSMGKGQALFDQAYDILKSMTADNDKVIAELAQTADAASTKALVASRLIQTLLRVHLAEKNVIIETSLARRKPYEDLRQKELISIDAAAAQLDLLVTPDEQPVLSGFKKAVQVFADISHEVAGIALLAETPQETTEARTLSASKGQTAFGQAETALQALIKTGDVGNAAAKQAEDQATTRMLHIARPYSV